MGAWRLQPVGGGAPLSLPEGRAVVVGRAPSCDIQLDNDTISRRHAELRPGALGIAVLDLGSSNGVQVNGVRVRRALLSSDDLVGFGTLSFRVILGAPPAGASRISAVRFAEAEDPSDTALRAIDVRSGGGALARLQAEPLARLVDLARQLSGTIELERLLELVVEQAAALLPADRVALLLSDAASGELRPQHARNRLGEAPVEVPRSIAQRALLEKLPISTDNALADARFQSGSVVRSQVRAALCVPLLAAQDHVVGVLYVDSLTATVPFSEGDAALCFAFAGLAAVSIAKAHFAEAARREALARANFERFFAPAVAARIAAQQSGVRPGGERRTVTVLYSDVRGFTRLAESLPPETVAAQLSEYFAAMVELLFAHGGTLDKFIGDALLALWGAPLPAEDAADRAVAAARAMQEEMGLLNARWSAAGRPVLGIGIGLHHGEAFTGTIGSPRRLEYTVIGDVVNVAARLCEAAELGQIVLSEDLCGKLQPAPADLVPQTLRLRGREESVLAYRMECVR
jgi:adenylate cyclase